MSGAIAFGFNAGQIGVTSGAVTGQGTNSIAIGVGAGQSGQGSYAIAIGFGAGQAGQHSRSIVLNANTSVLNTATTGAFYVNPIRTASTVSFALLMYNKTTREVVASSADTSLSSKSFVIQHPQYRDKYLVHCCLEGPEVGVYYRGESFIQNNRFVEITLPSYVSEIATNFSVQITPIQENEDEEIRDFRASRVRDNKFKVFGKNGCFFWHVYGNRDINLNVEPNKSDYDIKNVGPYTWLERN